MEERLAHNVALEINATIKKVVGVEVFSSEVFEYI